MAINWEAIGAVGEVMVAVAVVLALAYLAVQVRQTRRSMVDAANSQYYTMLHQRSYSKSGFSIRKSSALKSSIMLAISGFSAGYCTSVL